MLLLLPILISFAIAAPHVGVHEVDHHATHKETPWHYNLHKTQKTTTLTTTTTKAPTTTTTTPEPTTSNGHYSLREDLELLRSEFYTVKSEISDWMNQPFTQRVVIPGLMGCLAAVITMSLLCCCRACFNRCQVRRRRSRICALSRDVAGEKRHLVPAKDSDDEI